MKTRSLISKTGIVLEHILNLANLLNSENGRLPKTEFRSSKEYEFCKSESLEEDQQACEQILDLSKVSKTFCFWQWKVLETFQTYRFQNCELKE